MPFKTKKQKLAASERRFTFVDGKVSLFDIKTNDPKKGSESAVYTSQDSAIKEDVSLGMELLKIVTICAIIIGIQVGLRLTLF